MNEQLFGSYRTKLIINPQVVRRQTFFLTKRETTYSTCYRIENEWKTIPGSRFEVVSNDDNDDDDGES
jgi:hypothetical protein